MSARAPAYDIIIGLEVHVQLLTASKMFCACSTRFGEPPNTQTCPVCIGMPGALPVMNGRALELALRAALALNCQIARLTKWDRKNYYYPDLPKGYQISQYDLPLGRQGYLDIRDPKGRFPERRIGIIRVHLEEDAGKSMHDEVAGRADSRIDLNRAGTPLPCRGQGFSYRAEAATELPGGFRLQHAGGQPPGGREHQPPCGHARGPGPHAHRGGEEHVEFSGCGAGPGL